MPRKVIENKEEHRAETKRLTTDEDSLKKVINLLITKEVFNIEVSDKILKFYRIDENNKRIPVSEISSIENFILEPVSKMLEDIDVEMLEINSEYASLKGNNNK